MTSIKRFSMILGGSALLLALGVANAQDLGALKSMAGGGGDLSSVASGSAGNAAGVVEFCIKNNYLSGDAASSMKDKLMGKIGGSSESEQDKASYTDGAAGLLTTGDGQKIDLAKMGCLKKSITKKACASVLEHAKSML